MHLAPLLALASGAAALLYQIVWLRWFKLLFGSTAYAASATLCAFFLGLALGAALFAGRAGRSPAPLRDYGRVEIGVGLTALLVPLALELYVPFYAALYVRLADTRELFLVAKFGLALAGMLPTTILLGGAPPLLTAAALRERGRLGREGGFLYATNTLGAALGTAAGALWLPEAIGLQASYGVALVLSTGVGLAALGAARAAPALPAPAPRLQQPSAHASRALLALAAASGFGTIAFEVLLFHALAQILQSSVYSIGAVLLVVLASLSGAAYAVAGTTRRVTPRRALCVALGVEAILLLALPGVVHALTGGLGVYLQGSLENGLLLALLLGAPALFVGGLVLPLCFRLADDGPAGQRLGGLLAANTAGAIAGSLAASFLLLEQFGLWGAIVLLAGGYALLAIAAAPGGRAAGATASGLAVGSALVLLVASPFGLPVVMLRPGESLLAVREGPHGIVSVTQEADGNRWLKIDNYYGLSSSAASRRQQRWGHLSLVHHPDPRRVLFLGSATGGTAASAVVHPVDEIVLVEIVPEVNELARQFFADANRGVHADPRTRLVVEDARNHLRAAPELYDVIVADLFVPWLPSTSALFSREHFAAARAHLAPHGVFAQWLPLYQLGREEFETIAASFLDVFPDATVWRGDFSAQSPTVALVGTLDPPPPLRVLAERGRDLGRLGVDDRWLFDPRGLAMLYLGPLAALGDVLASSPRTTDDRPMVEFLAGRKDEEARARFRSEVWPVFAARLADGAEAGGAGEAAAGARAGNTLVRANALATQGADHLVARAASLLAGVVPADLLQPPDPSAGEFWPDLRAKTDDGATAR